MKVEIILLVFMLVCDMRYGYISEGCVNLDDENMICRGNHGELGKGIYNKVIVLEIYQRNDPLVIKEASFPSLKTIILKHSSLKCEKVYVSENVLTIINDLNCPKKSVSTSTQISLMSSSPYSDRPTVSSTSSVIAPKYSYDEEGNETEEFEITSGNTNNALIYSAVGIGCFAVIGVGIYLVWKIKCKRPAHRR